jgi:hypothetical protein
LEIAPPELKVYWVPATRLTGDDVVVGASGVEMVSVTVNAPPETGLSSQPDAETMARMVTGPVSEIGPA